MKIKHKLGLLFPFLIILSGCGESLEDTYKDYAGDGHIRYIGMCTDVTIAPEWESLVLNWENSLDPNATHVKIVWQAEQKDSISFERGISTYEIKNLQNLNYEVAVYSMDESGKTSLPTVVYGRPYTAEHEMVQSFTRLVSNHIFVDNRLVLFFQGWRDNSIISAKLKYTRKDGTPTEYELTRNIVNRLYYLLPDEIDPSKPVELYREGKLEGSSYVIAFDPYVLEDVNEFTMDLKQFFTSKYGFSSEVPRDWILEQTELEIDCDLTSFEDILRFPNLKKVVLGKNRFLDPETIKEAEAKFTVYDIYKSNFVLQIANEIRGIEVERYNNHFDKLTKKPYIKEMGSPAIPTVNMIDLSKASVILSPKDGDSFNSHPEKLIDNDYLSSWQPILLENPTTYEIAVDLKEVKHISGMTFVQKAFEATAYDFEKELAPKTLKIKVSTDGVTWEDATYLEDVSVGYCRKEVNFIPFTMTGKEARWVKVIVDAVFYQGRYTLTFAEIGLY